MVWLSSSVNYSEGRGISCTNTIVKTLHWLPKGVIFWELPSFMHLVENELYNSLFLKIQLSSHSVVGTTLGAGLPKQARFGFFPQEPRMQLSQGRTYWLQSWIRLLLSRIQAFSTLKSIGSALNSIVKQNKVKIKKNKVEYALKVT